VGTLTPSLSGAACLLERTAQEPVVINQTLKLHKEI